MTIQPPGGPDTVPPQAHTEPYGSGDDWNSPLWGRPDTVAATWAKAHVEQPVAPSAPAEPARRTSRALLATAAVAVLVVAMLGSFLVTTALGRGSSPPAAVAPRPSVSLPTTPTPTPSQPSLTPPSEGSGSQGGQGSQGAQGSTGLTQAQQAAVASVSPALVDVVSTIGYDGAQGAGTGIVLTSDGTVLTNHHVVAGATSISVTDIGNGRTYAAKVVGYDRSHDVAVLKLSGATGLATAPLGESSTVSVGDPVVAVGNALGKGGAPTAVAGTVTALNRSISAQDSSNGTAEPLSGLIQVDAPIQPGDSGGALIDADGKVVGVVTAGSAGGAQDAASTQGFAVPMSTAQSVAEQIIAGRSSSTVHIGGTAFLGLQVSGTVSGSSVAGVPVAGTVPGSAAAGAGIVTGDVVTAFDGRTVANGDELKAALDGHHPGDSVSVRWTDRSGVTHTARVTLTDGPTG